ncbi:MAG: MATE family efflux transporter [Bacteroidetes bacterium]|nr:MATE family efflux transporter [Bacteroidota bacterium]
MLLSAPYKKSYYDILKIAYPVCLSNLGHITVGIVDTAMVGQVSTTAQAGVALAGSLFYILLVFGIGIAFGVTPYAAEADAQNNHSKIKALLKNSLVLNFLVNMILVLILIASSPLLRKLDQPMDVVEIAIPFLEILTISLIPLSIFSAFKQFAEGLSDTKIAMFISVAGNVVNIFLNYVLIFGKWGFPKMGVLGSAWASLYARIIMAIGMSMYIFTNKKFKAYSSNFIKEKTDFKEIYALFKVGVASGLQWVFEVGAFSCAVIMAGWLGTKQQAAHQIAVSIAAATYMIASGISAGVSVKVGNAVGERNKEHIKISGNSGFILVLAFMSLSCILLIACKNYFPLLFSKDIEVIEMAASLIVIAGIFQLFDGAQVVGLGALRGLKDAKIPTITTLFAYWIIGLPVGYFLAFTLNMGVQGIWWGLSVGLLFSAVALYARFKFIAKSIHLE